MGDRGQVLIVDYDKEDEGVYLYTHWGATDLVEVVRDAMKRKLRWDDPCYLARIIFSEMIRDEIDGETGYGICTNQHGDIWRLVKVNCNTQQVTLMDEHWTGDKPEWRTTWTKTFDEFIKEEE